MENAVEKSSAVVISPADKGMGEVEVRVLRIDFPPAAYGSITEL